MIYRKYYAKKTTIDGITFDSKMESRRYIVLKDMLERNEIQDLKIQPRFLLQEGFKKNGKTYRKIEYVADFMYIKDNNIVIEDIKGFETTDFKIKHKLFEYKYPQYELKIIKEI